MGIPKRSRPRNGRNLLVLRGTDASATADMIGADGRSPFDANVFLTSSEDSKSFVVDISRLNDAQDLPFESGIVPGVIMSHVGHRLAAAAAGSEVAAFIVLMHSCVRSPVVYLDWNPCDQWTIASISDESAVQVGGGTLQIWRLSDLVTIPIEDLAAELESVAA